MLILKIIFLKNIILIYFQIKNIQYQTPGEEVLF